MVDWRAIRYSVAENIGGVGATGTAMLLSAPTRVYLLRGVVYTAAGRAQLYDHTNLPQNPVALLAPGVSAPDQFPPTPLHFDVQRGLYVSFSMGTGGLAVWAGFERK